MNPFQKYSAEQIEEFKVQFDNLSICEKFRLWSNTVYFNYTKVGYTCSLEEAKGFLIVPKNEEEQIELNSLIIEELKIFDLGRFKPTIFELDDLKAAFESKLLNAVNPSLLFEKELQWINDLVRSNETKVDFNQVKDISDFEYHFYSEQSKRFWIHGFNEYYIYRKDFDLSRAYDPKNLIAYYIGYNIAGYKVYLEHRQNTNWAKPEIVETPIKKQILLLHYLGILDLLNDVKNKDRDKIFALLLNRSITNVRQQITDLPRKGNSIKTKENLEFILNLLTEAGLKEKAQIVKNDLDRLS